jgi:hypothetical protein
MNHNFQLVSSTGLSVPALTNQRETERFVAYGTGLCYLWSLDWDGFDIAAALAEWHCHLESIYGVAGK